MSKRALFISLVLIFNYFNQRSLASPEIKKQRIISLTPATTEILFSLGLNKEIVGVTTFCSYPPQAMNKEKIGTFSQPNIERILLLKPDIIFATGLEQASTVRKLKQLRLNVYVSNPSNIQELFVSIEEIGKLTRKKKEALNLINQIKTEIERIKERVESIPQDKRPTVFIEFWHDPLMTAGKGSFVDELINLAGGINIAHDTPRAYSYFSAEQVIKRNPDCIILGYMSKGGSSEAIRNRLGWQDIKAVRDRCVYNDINPDLFLRPGPRLTEGLGEIHRRLYPE